MNEFLATTMEPKTTYDVVHTPKLCASAKYYAGMSMDQHDILVHILFGEATST
jgi:hypothetical protein